MQSRNLAFVISQAQDEQQTDPLALAVRDSIEVGVVVPSILRSKLMLAGFSGIEDEAALAEYGFASLAVLKRVVIVDEDRTIVAMGASSDHDDALLHAMLGWFREHPLPESEIPAGLGTR